MFSLGHSFTEAQQVRDNHFDLAMRRETHHNITKIQLDSQEGRGAPWEQRSMLNGKKKKKSQVPLGLSLETRKLPRVRQVDPATCKDSEGVSEWLR
jgi:hypothetical protein